MQDRLVWEEELIMIPICKDIDIEDVADTPLYGQPAAIDSAPTPNATSMMKLWD